MTTRRRGRGVDRRQAKRDLQRVVGRPVVHHDDLEIVGEGRGGGRDRRWNSSTYGSDLYSGVTIEIFIGPTSRMALHRHNVGDDHEKRPIVPAELLAGDDSVVQPERAQ